MAKLVEMDASKVFATSVMTALGVPFTMVEAAHPGLPQTAELEPGLLVHFRAWESDKILIVGESEHVSNNYDARRWQSKVKLDVHPTRAAEAIRGWVEVMIRHHRTKQVNTQKLTAMQDELRSLIETHSPNMQDTCPRRYDNSNISHFRGPVGKVMVNAHVEYTSYNDDPPEGVELQLDHLSMAQAKAVLSALAKAAGK